MNLSFNLAQPQGLASTLQIILLITVLSLAPAILVLTTSFTRIIVVLSFLRNALAAGQTPPNQVLVGLALFMTFFLMAPTWGKVYQEAWLPLQKGEINQTQAFDRAQGPVRAFMLRYTRKDDLALFLSAQNAKPATPEETPLTALLPAFVISELKTAFEMGFLIYVPFLVIDMVVSSVLMSMGMLMLPPTMVSLPFKLLLFVLVDGWHLIAQSLLTSFR